MELVICHSDGTNFVTPSGVQVKFTVIAQQEPVPPESGQLPARAFENKTVFLTGQGTPTDGGWIYSTRVLSVLDAPLGQILKGISTGNP